MAAHLKRQDPLDTVEDLSPGNPALRRQIALRYLIAGINIPASDIVVTNGALEALNLCLQAVTRPGDTVIVEAPTFYGALQALERQGLKALEVPTHPRTGMDLDALESAIARHRPAACWLMTQFQNPLGSLMPDERKRQLVELLTRHDIPLIEDDVYGELYFGATRPVPAKAYDTQGLVLHCSSFSKCLAPGYRIGWASAGRYTQRVQRLAVVHAVGVRPGAGRHRGIPGTGRLRPSPAPAARHVADPAGPDGDGGGPCVSRRHAHDTPARRLLPVAGAAPGHRRAGAASPGAGARHQRRARPDFLGQRSVRQRAAPELRPPLNEAQAEAVRTLGELALAALARPRPGARDLTLGP